MIKYTKKSKNNIPILLKLRFKLKDRISIYEKLQSYIEEEFPVYDSLLKFKQRYDKKKDFKGKIIGFWLEKIKKGDSFSKAIAGWVPESELNLIAAGENGTGIADGLKEAIKFANSTQKIKSTIIGGAMYPIVLLLVVFVFTAMFSKQIAPAYLDILPLERWPSSGQTFYLMSKFLVDYWMVLLMCLIGISVTIGLTIGKWTGSLRKIADKFPPWSVYKVYQASSFLIGLASMMRSGIPLNDSLIKMKKSSSLWLATYLDEMIRNLRHGGKNFGKHLDVGLLDDETAGDVVDYSELGKFEVAIYSIGEKNLEESVQKINQRMGLIRNIMIVIVGITVGLIYYTSVELNGTVAEAASSKNR